MQGIMASPLLSLGSLALKESYCHGVRTHRSHPLSVKITPGTVTSWAKWILSPRNLDFGWRLEGQPSSADREHGRKERASPLSKEQRNAAQGLASGVLELK